MSNHQQLWIIRSNHEQLLGNQVQLVVIQSSQEQPIAKNQRSHRGNLCSHHGNLCSHRGDLSSRNTQVAEVYIIIISFRYRVGTSVRIMVFTSWKLVFTSQNLAFTLCQLVFTAWNLVSAGTVKNNQVQKSGQEQLGAFRSNQEQLRVVRSSWEHLEAIKSI